MITETVTIVTKTVGMVTETEVTEPFERVIDTVVMTTKTITTMIE